MSSQTSTSKQTTTSSTSSSTTTSSSNNNNEAKDAAQTQVVAAHPKLDDSLIPYKTFRFRADKLNSQFQRGLQPEFGSYSILVGMRESWKADGWTIESLDKYVRTLFGFEQTAQTSIYVWDLIQLWGDRTIVRTLLNSAEKFDALMGDATTKTVLAILKYGDVVAPVHQPPQSVISPSVTKPSVSYTTVWIRAQIKTKFTKFPVKRNWRLDVCEYCPKWPLLCIENQKGYDQKENGARHYWSQHKPYFAYLRYISVNFC